MNGTNEVKTRILFISDTHGRVPLSASEASSDPDNESPFRDPLPTADVLFHAGDLSFAGYEIEHLRTVQMLKSAQAELKIVIPGNHDITLDKVLFDEEGEETFRREEVKPTVERIKGLYCDKDAKAHNIVYLDEEGVHTFTLKNGAEFTIYTTPYTIDPWGSHWAFGYEEGIDRYNSESPDAQSPVPDHVDIVISHGPPKGVFDQIPSGKRVGCSHLWRAIERTKPRLHCFGHIHEAWGAVRHDWEKKEWGDIDISNQDKATQIRQHCAKLDVSKEGSSEPLLPGKETLFVNGSTLSLSYEARQSPWLIDIDLPTSKGHGQKSH